MRIVRDADHINPNNAIFDVIGVEFNERDAAFDNTTRNSTHPVAQSKFRANVIVPINRNDLPECVEVVSGNATNSAYYSGLRRSEQRTAEFPSKRLRFEVSYTAMKHCEDSTVVMSCKHDLNSVSEAL